jgi:uncharacterized protein YutE (UPF0331/DUF86 family)
MTDPELVTRKLLLITRDLEAVSPIGKKPVAGFLEAEVDRVLVERYLERMIGRMVDINYHLLTEAGIPPPADYFQSFLGLAALGVYDHVFATQVAACAGLRNRIAHEYDEIDAGKLFAGLQTALRDIPAYVRHVEAWLAGKGAGIRQRVPLDPAGGF